MYRCVAEVCGKGFPRKVNFCPFCGTRQGAAAQAAPAGRWADSGAAEAKAAALAAAQAEADALARAAERARAEERSRAEDQAREDQAKADEQARAARAEALAQARNIAAAQSGTESRQPPEQLTPEQQSALERLNKLKGIGKQATAPSAPAANPYQPQGNGAQPSRPPLRKPISKSMWVSVAVVLGLIWFLARPSDPAKKLQGRVDKAVAQAQDCNIDVARNEYTSLKADKASAAQLKYLQDIIGANAKKCDTRRHRAKAWSELRPQLDSALQNGSIDLADRRLAAFVKAWGADDETRDIDGRIDVRKGERLLNEADACIKRSDRSCAEAKLQAAEKLQRNELKTRTELLREALSDLLKRTVLDQREAAPVPVPAPVATPAQRAPQAAPAAQPAQTPQQSQQARKLLTEAERELRQGNYKAAMDKANICATMIDEGNRECVALKNRAERMNRDLMNCVAAGREWIDDRCQ
ncbi:hypothetical protein GJ700_05700 [Duganella sp. FT92W]|uniref:Uncharacterized protein n=1 Tax=Pseudoduganella rivuli TaxID=2666085 RepID=A0A7X2IKI0_9BURK|nr:hypothetical protein [Pseudoduganella rivuli]MRV71212.1 hypothetical protein [Pseudoduganella rivuli]